MRFTHRQNTQLDLVSYAKRSCFVSVFIKLTGLVGKSALVCSAISLCRKKNASQSARTLLIS